METLLVFQCFILTFVLAALFLLAVEAAVARRKRREADARLVQALAQSRRREADARLVQALAQSQAALEAAQATALQLVALFPDRYEAVVVDGQTVVRAKGVA